jgi:hypothetical protein
MLKGGERADSLAVQSQFLKKLYEFIIYLFDQRLPSLPFITTPIFLVAAVNHCH